MDNLQKILRQGGYGLLSGDSGIKMIMRRLQSSLYGMANGGGKYGSLADIGITTDAKTGLLNMDKSKVEAALTEDYEGVAKLFIIGPQGEGIGGRLAGSLKDLRIQVPGVFEGTKLKGYDRIIENQK